MTAWTGGYVTDLTYTHGFYRELTPALLAFAALAKGEHAPAADGQLTYCELGCGQGFSTNLLAAANPHISFHATDFNPAQIAGAQRLAAEAGTPNVQFHDHAFADFAREPSLPAAFDIIALHGIYSWISPENRAHIAAFIRDRLKPGGIVYISYNTLPGWAAAMPLRRLLVDQAGTRTGPIVPRIEEALDFAERLRATKPLYLAQNPAVETRLEGLKGMSRNYLAHEYFNRDWTPFYFADVAAELAAAKLDFLGSANLLDHVNAINLTDEQAALLAEVADPVRREGLRDYMVNQQFRRDIFAKGRLPHSVASVREVWLGTRFILSTPRAEVSLKVTGSRGGATLQADTYEPILNALAKGPATLRQLIADPAVDGLGWGRLMQAFALLVGMGVVQSALPAKDDAKRAQRTRAFNNAVCERAKTSADLAYLASPVTGGGVAVDRVAQLFLLARARKDVDPVQFAWTILSAQGQALIKDGKTLTTPDENIAELRARLAAFTAGPLPVLQQLGIA